jgi:hypothetical protein
MYNKVIGNTLEQHEEIIISLNGNSCEKVLFYRDEGNVRSNDCKLNVTCDVTDKLNFSR